MRILLLVFALLVAGCGTDPGEVVGLSCYTLTATESGVERTVCYVQPRKED